MENIKQILKFIRKGKKEGKSKALMKNINEVGRLYQISELWILYKTVWYQNKDIQIA